MVLVPMEKQQWLCRSRCARAEDAGKKERRNRKKKDCQYHPVLNPLNRDAGDVGVHVSSMVNVRYMWSNVATYSDGRSCETGD